MKTLTFLLAVIFLVLAAPCSRAQFQQPLVFSSAGAVAVRNDQTGVLTPVAGSPFTAPNEFPFTIDVQGRFLFAPGVNSIHVFQITDSTTGAYQEVAGSPFASTSTNQPMFVAVEPTGKFIAVVNRAGQNPGEALVETFQISPTAAGGPAILPVAGSATELDSTPVGIAQPPDDKRFLIFMGPNQQSSNPAIKDGSEFQALSIDPQTGFITGLQQNAATSERGDSFALDPQGRYYAIGTQDSLEVGNIQIVGLDGHVPSGNVPLPQFHYPVGLWIDSTGTFLYAAISDLANPVVVNIYSVNLQTRSLLETSSSPLPNLSSVPPYFADPTGPFNYGPGTSANTLVAYTVDPLTGYFLPTADSPFTIPGSQAGFLTFSIPPGQQGVGGPAATLSATTLSLGTLQIGSTGTPQVVTLTSSGEQALTVNSISVSGADSADFTETNTCQVPTVLQPNRFCSISVTFTPSAAGSRQAVLLISDNAPGSPQSVQLSGTGVNPPPPAPAVTIAPNPVSFPSTTQGVTSSPISVTVTNSGNATLHIASVTLSGNNPTDFSMTSACNGPYSANASCTITLTFTPLAAGLRSATISISDDAQNSPQLLQVSGSATAVSPTNPVVSLAPSTLSFGAVTQGTASPQRSVTVTNSGGATLHISSVVLGGTSPSDFSLTNGCTAAAYPVSASCTLTVTFAPLLTGSRAAAITLTDDAVGSTQAINLNGTADSAITVGPAANGSTSATITAGQTAQYNLQITPGAGFTGSVSLTCGGAPLAATCQVPATLQISNGNPAPFTASVTTTGGAIASPVLSPPRQKPFLYLRVIPSLAAVYLLLLLAFLSRRHSTPAPRRLAFTVISIAVLFMALSAVAGCGGGSASTTTTTTTPPVVTPQGTFTIMITPAATSTSGKPLQLQAISLTLTVN